MNVPVQVRRRTLPVCEKCAAPLRLAASITSGKCCCCRASHEDTALGCLVCGKVLGDCDAATGVCAACAVLP